MSGQALAKPLQMGAWVVAALGALYFLYGLFTDDLVGGGFDVDFLPKMFVMLENTMVFVIAFTVMMVGGKFLERN